MAAAGLKNKAGMRRQKTWDTAIELLKGEEDDGSSRGSVDVNIYKSTIEDKIEERILAILKSKRALATAVIGGDKIKNLSLTWKISSPCSCPAGLRLALSSWPLRSLYIQLI